MKLTHQISTFCGQWKLLCNLLLYFITNSNNLDNIVKLNLTYNAFSIIKASITVKQNTEKNKRHSYPQKRHCKVCGHQKCLLYLDVRVTFIVIRSFAVVAWTFAVDLHLFSRTVDWVRKTLVIRKMERVKGKELEILERRIIIELRENGNSYGQIANITKRSCSTTQRVIENNNH